MQTIFYSWQSDLPNSTNRSFIQTCLEKAIKELRAEGAVHIDPAPDRDTQGVPGSPDIADTIFEKIDNCAAFVGDVSIINGCHPTPPKLDCDCTRPTPNPNVMGEWGRATKAIGFERIIAVINEATGKIDDLPFDMRKRRVLTYKLRVGDDKTDPQKMLVGKLKSALKSVLELPPPEPDFAEANKMAGFKLSPEARTLLVKAATGGGHVMHSRFIGGSKIAVGGSLLNDPVNRRSVAIWEQAINDLVSHDLLVQRGYYPTESFEVTAKGYELADLLKERISTDTP